ncbi:MAG: 1-acyl-sn-glycerol-3-phosphate acyltransferase, partial [Saprospiraceae bacterium]|nr:1-acyl-sn-glycerol-3-phosphate acyltransferase [Saprospiraceae bacterium]
MLYKILRQIVASLFKIYFRKIYLIDSSKVPLKGPVLISSNHPMAFAEACLLACFIDRPLYFLVRGDVFKKGWNWFFNGTNQIPIYRFRDGFSNMRRNRDSFSRAHDALADDKAILIFSEGNTRLQKKLSPLQKGLARLAFGAYAEKNVQHIQVVPVG